MISTRKYRLMKRFKGTLTTEQESQISEYENSTLSVKFSEPEPEVIPRDCHSTGYKECL